VTSQEPTSFRAQSDAAIHAPTDAEGQPIRQRSATEIDKFYTPNTQAAYRGYVNRLVDVDPALPYAVEGIARTYPMISADLLAAIAIVNPENIPSELLDEMVQRDLAAQERAASEGNWYGTFKGISRNFFIGAEDLYNVSPLMAGARLGINLFQGESLEASLETSFASTLRNQIRVTDAGFEHDYGSGFLPSQELVPQGVGFWTSVRESIITDEFEGSPEEQLIQAQHKAMKDQVLKTGFNPYAMSVREWESTQISRTIHGVNYAVPFSPGAAVALGITTPGTNAYNWFSGGLDATARMVLEPVDVAFDNVGQVFKAFSPVVFSDDVVGINKGGTIWRSMLDDMGIIHVDRPLLVPVKDAVDNTGRRIHRAMFGGTTTDNIPQSGVARIELDPAEMTRRWQNRVKDLSNESGTEWLDLDHKYVRHFTERGMSPNDATRELSRRGGENGQYFLTLEHELVHSEVQQGWYNLVPDPDHPGRLRIDDAKLKPDAPEELQVVARQLEAEHLSLEELDEVYAGVKAADESVNAQDEVIGELMEELKGTKNKGRVKQLNEDLRSARQERDRLVRTSNQLGGEYNTKVERFGELTAQASDFVEDHASRMAWDRMMSGDWEAPRLYKKWKRQAGLSKLMRPWVNQKAATEWLQSNMGRRTIERLAKTTELDQVKKYAPYLDDQDWKFVTQSVDEGEISEIVRRSINADGTTLRPTIGIAPDLIAHGFDDLRIYAQFRGGRVAAAHRQMGRTLRRARSPIQANTLSVVTDSAGNQRGNIEAISSIGHTIGIGADEVTRLQIKAIETGHTRTGIDEIYAELKAASINKMKGSKTMVGRQSVYTDDEVEWIWKQWEGYDDNNKHFWVSNKGRDRKIIFRDGKYQHVSDLDETAIKGQAFMEAQYALTTRTMPEIRSLRRLHSRQRNSWERVRARAMNAPDVDGGYRPLGFNKSTLMGVGDWSFGIWRDLQLMRGGWAMRIIPEEQLRFGASGYSGLFKNPSDYFISLLNRMDFKIPGDELTLGDILRTEEALGTAGLRDLRTPVHIVKQADWTIARQVENPELFWAGMVREFLLNTHDPIVTRVAAVGPDEAFHFFTTTTEGKQAIKQVAMGAKKESSLALVGNPRELRAMVDTIELRIAQISGGDGIWYNSLKQQWQDINDVVKNPIPDKPGGAFPNKDSIKQEILLESDDPNVLRGKSGASRAELKELLNEVRGYDLDHLDATEASAFVTREGNSDLRTFIHTRQLDDITITDDMPIESVRAIDKKLEQAYLNRGVDAPEFWPVPRNEMEANTPGLYNKVVDTFFEWFNAVPSQVLNRQPFFNQAYGSRLASAYFYGDSNMRAAIDKMRATNPDFADTFDVGQRKLFRDLGVSKNPQPFENVDTYRYDPAVGIPEPTSGERYAAAVSEGRYDRIPLSGDPEAYVSHALFEALEQLDVQEADGVVSRTIYRPGNQSAQGVDTPSYSAYPGIGFAGGDRLPFEEWVSGSVTPYGHIDDGNPLEQALVSQITGKQATLDEIGDIRSIIDEDMPITREVFENYTSFSPDVIDQLMAEPTFINRLNDMRTLRTYVDGEAPSAEHLAAAEALGWRRLMRTSGIANSYLRTPTYGSYVDVHRIDHWPQWLQDEWNTTGDVEQLSTLGGGRYPNLYEIPDIAEHWRAIRLETDFKHTRPPWDVDPGNPNPSRFTRFQLRDIKEALEERMGRPFSREEAMELDALWSSQRTPWKHVIDYEGIEPAGRLPTDLAVKLNERGMMVTTPREVGDLSLLLDENTRKLQVEQSIIGNTPPLAMPIDELPLNRDQILDDLTVQPVPEIEASRGYRDTPLLSTDEKAAWNAHELAQEKLTTSRMLRWWETTGLEPDPIAGVIDFPVVTPEVTMHNYSAYDALDARHIIDTPEGPELALDYGFWIESEEFRSVATAWADEAAELDQRAGRYARLHGEVKPDGTFSTEGVVWGDEMEELAREAAAFEYKIDAIRKGHEWRGGVSISPGGDEFPWEPAQIMRRHEEDPSRVFQSIENNMREFSMMIDEYNEAGARILTYEAAGAHTAERPFDAPNWDGFNLAGIEPKPETIEMLNAGGNINLDFSAYSQMERREAIERIFPGAKLDKQRYAGGVDDYSAVKTDPMIPQGSKDELESVMRTAKMEAIEETKQVFYDLSNKANIADALKFVFPFGDAWYEVLTRWMHIMNPVSQGGQPLRNVRRVQQTFNAGRQSGFISTNEYGEEVFNWPLAPGMMSNSFIPSESNVSMRSVVPVSSLMFIDPSARGVGAPGTSPIWQLSIQFTAPYTEGIPVFHDALQWLTYGDKTQYRPGEIDELDDVLTGFAPTTINRLTGWIFSEQAREMLGTTKLRLFQSLGLSGDPNFDLTTPEGSRKAWDIANTTGTWLSWLRILDAWSMPGQPQYQVAISEEEPDLTREQLAAIPDISFEDFLAEIGNLDLPDQGAAMGAIRLAAEYRHARDMFSESEADIYMLQRHNVVPALLQSASTGLVDYPVSYGGIEWVNDNEWLLEAAPFTLAGTIPADADDTFSSAAWNNLFSTFLKVGGVESQAIRSKRSPAEFAQALERSVGYDQLNYQQFLYDRAVAELRSNYGENYASKADYRSKKRQLDRILRDNKDAIYTEFQIVRGSNQGSVIGSTEGVGLRNMVDEIMTIGKVGTKQNSAFRTNAPHLADVAEQYSTWFYQLEAISRMQDKGTASSEWWVNGESDAAEYFRKQLVDQAQGYFDQLTNPDQIAYAKWLNENLLDDLMRDWEWIDRKFAPELKSFPSVWKASTLSIGGSE